MHNNLHATSETNQLGKYMLLIIFIILTKTKSYQQNQSKDG